MATIRTRRRVGGRPTRPPTTPGVRFVQNAAEDARLKRLQDQAKTAAAARTARAAEAKAKGQPFLEHGDHRNTHQHKHPQTGKQPTEEPVEDVVLVLRGVQRYDRTQLAAAMLREINACNQYSARLDPYSPKGNRVCRLWANPEAEAVLNLMAYPKGVQGRGTTRFPTAGVAIPGRHGGPIYEAPRGMVHLYEYSSDDNEGAADGVHPNDVGTKGGVKHVVRDREGNVLEVQLDDNADPWGNGRNTPPHFTDLGEGHSDWDSDPGVYPPPGVGRVPPRRAGRSGRRSRSRPDPSSSSSTAKNNDNDNDNKGCRKPGYPKPDNTSNNNGKKTTVVDGIEDQDSSDHDSDPFVGKDKATTTKPCGKGGNNAQGKTGGAPKGSWSKQRNTRKRGVTFDDQGRDSGSDTSVLQSWVQPPPPPAKKQKPDADTDKKAKEDEEKAKAAEKAKAEKAKADAKAKADSDAKAKKAKDDAAAAAAAAALLPGTVQANRILAEYKNAQQKKDSGWFGGLFGKKGT